MDRDSDLAEVEREVLAIQAAVLACEDITDDEGPAELERLMWTALDDGCPPRLAITLLIAAFTVNAGRAA